MAEQSLKELDSIIEFVEGDSAAPQKKAQNTEKKTQGKANPGKKGSGKKQQNKGKKQPQKGKKQPQKKKQPPKKGKRSAKKAIRLKKEYNNPTPKGEKKDVSKIPMPAEYDPPFVEAAWYEWWEKKGFFGGNSKDNSKDKFIMMIPPPNVTGSLHMGHALTNSIQDALARWHRMNGKNVLWLPGTDHAGIATQVVVEKKLKREQNLTRHDLGREKFVEQVWKWKEQYGARITLQLRRLGSSLDWPREAFTMDPNMTRAVKEAFVRMYDEGLIYRRKRLVNWCCELRTAISDIEVDKKEILKRTRLAVPGHDEKVLFGALINFKYPIEDSDEFIIVSTTRIETMLGDTAVAVHPKDERYTKFHGKFVIHPFDGRRIPIITDGQLVDKEFGTGCVKVTPAHDKDDYRCGLRHKLPMINIFTDEGFINENGGKFKGMKRFVARVEILKELKQKGLIESIVDHKMVLPICSRSKDVVEPILKPQWWVNCQDMAKDAINAVKDGELKIIPDTHVIKWYRWLEDIQDWCISRQLWWGHRIPAYLIYIEGQGEPDQDKMESWIAGRDKEEALERAAKRLGIDKSKLRLEQDPDVLDTWFSAGLFPFSTLGWPDQNSEDFKAFYPGSLLETGHDILFFWVARMVMMGQKLTGQLPFKEVFLHAMVRDAHGRKMSKSLGNVLDPIDVTEGITLGSMQEKLKHGNLAQSEVEIALEGQRDDFPDGISECGTDAMRFALCAYTAQGRSINMNIDRVIAYRHFCNKIWNMVKFFFLFAEGGKKGEEQQESTPFKVDDINSYTKTPIEKWLLSQLYCATRDSSTGWKDYDFSRVTSAIYNFILHGICDVYLEAIKPYVDKKGTPEWKSSLNTLLYVIETSFRLLHPFMPFITEELWQRIPKLPKYQKIESISLAPYPQTEELKSFFDETGDKNVTLALEVVHHARSLRSASAVKPSARPEFYLLLNEAGLEPILRKYLDVIKVLTKAGTVHIMTTEEQKKGIPLACTVETVNEKCEIHLYLKGLVDPDLEIRKVQKKIDRINKTLQGLGRKMSIPTYTTKVPEKVRIADAEKVKSFEKELKILSAAISKFESLKK